MRESSDASNLSTSKRVLHVYSGNLFGGVERMLATFARASGDCGLSHEFALCFEGELTEQLNIIGSSWHDLGMVRLSRPGTVRRARRNLEKVLRAGEFDCVICHSSWALAVFGPALGKLDVPLVLWVHDRLQRTSAVDRLASRTPPDAAICNSAYSEGSVSTLYGDIRSLVIHCPSAPPAGRPNAESSELRLQLGAARDDCIVLIAARFEAWKGHETLVDALCLLRDTPNWVCWILGDPQSAQQSRLVTRLMSLAKDGLIEDRIRFVGHQSEPSRYFAAADVYCQPNTRPEPFGLTFIEALGAGLPVVTTSVGGGAEEILDSRTAVFVPPSAPQQLANALRELIQVPGRRARYDLACRRRAAEVADVNSQLVKLRQEIDSVVASRIVA